MYSSGDLQIGGVLRMMLFLSLIGAAAIIGTFLWGVYLLLAWVF